MVSPEVYNWKCNGLIQGLTYPLDGPGQVKQPFRQVDFSKVSFCILYEKIEKKAQFWK